MRYLFLLLLLLLSCTSDSIKDTEAIFDECSGSGDLTSAFDGDAFSVAGDVELQASWVVTGSGKICSVDYDVPHELVWISNDALVCFSGGEPDVLPLPVIVTTADSAGICVLVDATELDVGTKGDLVVATSSGVWTATYEVSTPP